MNTVISLATGGLGNRIKVYASSMAKYDIVKTSREPDTILFDNIQKSTQDDIVKYPKVDGWRLDVEEYEQKYIDTYNTIDFLYEKTPNYFIEKYSAIFSNFKINSEIVKIVNSFSNEWENVIGVHIRSWYCSRSSWHSNSLFENQIEKCDSNAKIFLCTDNANIAEYFIGKYGDRIIQYPQNRYINPHMAESCHNYDAIDNMNAFIDMLLLSKCPKIIGTFGSTFTECAWWLSGCKSEVIIPMPDNVPQEFIDDVFSLK
jgi:hypothetical protein